MASDMEADCCHLLVIVGEPQQGGVRQSTIEFAKKGLRHWDAGFVGVGDFSAALDAAAAAKPEPTQIGQNAAGTESISRFSGFGVNVTLVFNARQSSVKRCLASASVRTSPYSLVIYAGACDVDSGAWILSDGVFGAAEFALACRVGFAASSGATSADPEPSLPSSRLLRLHLPFKGNFASVVVVGLEVRTTDAADATPSFDTGFELGAGLAEAMERETRVPHEDSLLPAPVTIGALERKGAAVYAFPAEDSDCFVFAAGGYTMLVDGGHGVRSCFWPMIGNLGSLDLLAITHIGHNNIQGISTFLSRKIKDGASSHPEIEHLLFNAVEPSKGGEGEVNGGESLLNGLGVSLASEADKLVERLAQLNLQPTATTRGAKTQPVMLYFKVGLGRLDLYPIHPAEDGKELRTFLTQWKEGTFGVDERGFPVPDQASLAFALVWTPANVKKPPVRLLYPGRCSPDLLAEGLDLLKEVPVFRGFDGKAPVSPRAPTKGATGKLAPGGRGDVKEKSPRSNAPPSRRPAPGAKRAPIEASSSSTVTKNVKPTTSASAPIASSTSGPSVASKKPTATKSVPQTNPAVGSTALKPGAAGPVAEGSMESSKAAPKKAPTKKEAGVTENSKKEAKEKKEAKAVSASSGSSVSGLVAKSRSPRPAASPLKANSPRAAAASKTDSPRQGAKNIKGDVKKPGKTSKADVSSNGGNKKGSSPTATAAADLSAKTPPVVTLSFEPDNTATSGTMVEAEDISDPSVNPPNAENSLTFDITAKAGSSTEPKVDKLPKVKIDETMAEPASNFDSMAATGSTSDPIAKMGSTADAKAKTGSISDAMADTGKTSDAAAEPVLISDSIAAITETVTPNEMSAEVLTESCISEKEILKSENDDKSEVSLSNILSKMETDEVAVVISAGPDTAAKNNDKETVSSDVLVNGDGSVGALVHGFADSIVDDAMIAAKKETDEDLAARARSALIDVESKDTKPLVIPLVRIDTVSSHSDTESEPEEIDPFNEEEKPPTRTRFHFDDISDDDSKDDDIDIKAFEKDSEPREKLNVAIVMANSADESTNGPPEASDVSLHENDVNSAILEGDSSPIATPNTVSRVSHGGSVYGACARAPGSFGSLDDADIGIEHIGAKVNNLVDTPNSLADEDVPFKRRGGELEVGEPTSPLKVETKPVISNPMSGDEGSPLSSPESLSPNAHAAPGASPTVDLPLADGSPGSGISGSDWVRKDGEQSPEVDPESGFAESDAQLSSAPSDQRHRGGAGELSSDSDSLLTTSFSPMDDFDPFPTQTTAKTDHLCKNPCTELTSDLSSLTIAENSPFPANDAAVKLIASSDASKESSPFANNGFPEAKVFNEMVQQKLSPQEIESSDLSPFAAEFAPLSGEVKPLSPDAPTFVPVASNASGSDADAASSAAKEEAAKIVDSWGEPLGLPPAKPASGARPKTPGPTPGSSTTGARPKAPAARPGTASRRAPSPASSVNSGPASKRGPVKKCAPGAAKEKPAARVIPFYFDVAYIPRQGRHETLGNFFSRVRARHYILSSIDPPASTLDALLEAKEKDWKPSNDSTDPLPPTVVVPTHESDTLRSWIPANIAAMERLQVEVSTPADRCTLHMQGHDKTSCPCFVIQCN